MSAEDLDRGLEEFRSALEGAQLQRVRTSKQLLIMSFHNRGETWSLVFDTLAVAPQFLLVPEEVEVPESKPNPVGLFLKAHGVGRRGTAVRRVASLGRVMEVRLGAEAPTVLTFVVVPHAVNVLVSAVRDGVEKTISWAKPQPLPSDAPQPPLAGTDTQEEVLSPEERASRWLSRMRSPSRTTSRQNGPKSIAHEKVALEKKLHLANEDLSRLTEARWLEAGEWLKGQGEVPIEVPDEWTKWIKKDLSFAENLKACFESYRNNLRKVERCKTRIEELRLRLDKMNALDESNSENVVSKPLAPMKFVETQTDKGPRARRVDIAEDLILYVGKSAEDNLALLRKAQPWDLWFHLREFVGAYGIVRRSRGRELSPLEQQEAALHVAHQSLSARRNLSVGDRFDVVMAECRKVKPVKGRVGLVTYHDEKVIRIQFRAI